MGIEAGEATFQAQGWTKERRIIVIREHKLELEEARGKQLFDDPTYKYQAIVTDKTELPEEIWRFYRSHADIENRIKELKWDYGMDGFCLKKFWATTAAFQLVCLLHNLLILFERKIGSPIHRTLSTWRVQVFACGAILGQAGRTQILRLALQGRWREQFLGYWQKIFPSKNTNCVAVESG